MKTVFALLMLLLVAGCGQMPTVAGGTSDFKMNPDGSFVIKNTKEYADVEAWIMSPNGNKQYYYHAKGVEAFEGQAITAQVQTMLADQQAKLFTVLPGLMAEAFSAALKAYTGGSVIAPPVLPAVPAPAPAPAVPVAPAPVPE